VIIFLIGRKIPKLKALDTETVPESKTAETRNRILLARMKRKTKIGKEIVQKGAKPVFGAIKNSLAKFFKKIYDLEKKYKKEAEEKVPLKGKDLDQKIKTYLQEAEALVKAEKYSDAEKKYIEIVSLEPKNLIAYRGLAHIYQEQKEYKQALQTLQFVLKVIVKESRSVTKKDDLGREIKTVSNASELVEAHTDLGQIYELMNKNEKTFEHYEKALQFQPNNPRNLDQMIQIGIIVKNKSLVIDLIKRLEEVNPDNQKLKDYQEKVTEL